MLKFLIHARWSGDGQLETDSWNDIDRVFHHLAHKSMPWISLTLITHLPSLYYPFDFLAPPFFLSPCLRSISSKITFLPAEHQLIDGWTD